MQKSFNTIQGGINDAVDGDTVRVHPGGYTENIDFTGKAIAVISSTGTDATTIDGGDSSSVVTFQSGEDQLSLLAGFTITGGDAEQGGGIYCSGSSPGLKI